MKRTNVLLLSFLLVLALVGCGKKAEEPKAQAPEAAPQAAAPALPAPPVGGETPSSMPPPMMGGEGAREMPGGMPPMTARPSQPKQVVVPEAVQKMWPAVKIMVKKKDGSDQGKIYELTPGQTLDIPGTALKVEAGQYLPDFFMDGQTITSKSADQVNPTVRLKVTDGGKEVYQGWAFEKYPEAHAFNDPNWSVTLVTGVKAK